jgi:O-antigen/teichoic acid export membrane protein
VQRSGPHSHAIGGSAILTRRRRTHADGPKKKGKSGGYGLLFKDSVIYGSGRALQKFLVALLLPLYTSFLSRADYGILGMVVTVTTFLDVFVTLGFDIAFSRFYFDYKTTEGHRKVITSVFYVSTVYPLILIGTCGLLLPRLVPLLLGKEYSTGDWRYFAVAFATLLFTNLNDLPITLFRLEHKPWTFTAYTLGRIAVQIPLSVALVAVFKWGPMGVLLANLFAAVVMQLAMLPTYVRKLNLFPDLHLLRPMLVFAVPALFTAMSFYWLKVSDRFFLLHYQGESEVGLYTVANSLAQPLYIVLMAFRMAWPQWHYAKLDDPPLHRRMVALSSTYYLVLNAMALVLMGAFLPLLVHVFLNHRFWSIAPTTFVLALSIALYGVYFIFWVGANVAKQNKMIPVFFLMASGLNMGLNFIFVPRYGMWAAAWTTVAGYGLLAATIYFYSERFYPIPYEWRRLIKLVAAMLISLAGVGAIMKFTGLATAMPLDALVVRTVATLPAVALFPITLLVSGFFNPGERARWHRLWHRGGGGQLPPAPPAHETDEETVESVEIQAVIDEAAKEGVPQ